MAFRVKTTGTKAAVEEHSERIGNTGEHLLDRLTATRTASLFVVAALISALLVADMGAARAQVSSGNGVAKGDVQLRDDLIADQESLLNSYRCLYNIDTHVVPGGCAGGKPVQGAIKPGTFTGTPSQQDISVRDMLIVTQESLLNAYRCLFNVDTQVVPGGCPDGTPAETKPQPEPEPTTVIADEKVPDVKVTFSSSTYSAKEGTTAQVNLMLDKAPNRTVVVPLTTAYQGGATPADFGTLPTSVTFAADESIQTVSFTVTDDQQADPGESLQLAIGQTLPDKVAAGIPGRTTINISDTGVPPVIDVSVFYCADESRGYNQADLIYETNLMNQVVGGFYSRESSGLSTVRFVPGGIVSPDLDWENLSINGERTQLWDSNHKGIHECFTEADPPGNYRQFLFITDIRPSWGASGFGWHDFNFPNLGESVGIAVVPTAESEYESIQFCSSVDGRPRRVREQPGTTLANLRSGHGYVANNVNCRYITYWNYLSLIGHEIGHSVYELGHPPGCSIMSQGYTDDDKCPTIYVDETMQFSDILNGYYIDCTDREKLGWPVVREECSSPPPPVEVGFALASYNAEEGTTAQVTVELDTVPFRTLTIPLAYTFKGGATAADTGTLPTTVTFGPTDTTKTITFAINDDNDDETGERVEITLGTPLPLEVTQGTLSQTTVSFTDDAPPQVQVSFASATYTADEGTTAQITVQLDTAPGRTLVILLTHSFYGGGGWDIDARTPTGYVTFSAHETTKTVTIDILNDNHSDPGERIEISFGRGATTPYGDRHGGLLPAGVTVGTPNRTWVHITDAAEPEA